MKKNILSLAACFLVVGMIACNNQKTEDPKPQPEAAKPAATTPAKVEPKTEISVGPTGGEVKTPDVKVKINTKDTLRK